MTNILIIAGAFLLDMLIGDPPNRYHPVAWMGKLIGFFWKRRPASHPFRLFLYGMLITLCGTLVFSLPLIPLEKLPELLFILITLPLLKASFSVRNLIRAGKEVLERLLVNDLSAARSLTAYHLVSRSTENLTEEEVAGAVIESLSENITDSLTSPLFCFVLLGLPGAWGFRYINTSDAMIGYRKEDFEWGGKFAARLDDMVNFIPARLTALIILLSGTLFRADLKNPFSLYSRVRLWQKETDSPNAGWTMASMAVVLNVQLEKKGHYLLNPEGRAASVSSLRRCLVITRISSLLTVAILCVLAGVIHGF